jgi:Bacterial conjugation TrbI-like protein
MRVRPFPFLIGLFFTAGAMAQTAPPQTEQGRSGDSQGSLASGMTINAELKSSIDSKKAKMGEPVKAEITEKVQSTDGRTILPKGAKVTGHLTQAEARSKGDKESMVAMQFDKATTKDGQEIPLNNVVIQAIAAPPNNEPSYSPGPGPSAAPSGPPAGNNPSMSGSSSPRTGGSTTGANPPNAYPGSAGGTEASGGGISGPLPPNSQGVYGLQNIKLARANTANGENSVIISNDKNVRLNSGTRLLLRVEPPQSSNETPGR